MSEISICIPTYEFKGDGVKYLSELFDTLQLQTFQDFNIVVSDHSVDDKIHDFCKEKSELFEIIYIRNQYGRGNLGPNTNVALEHGTGRILKVVFIHSCKVIRFLMVYDVKSSRYNSNYMAAALIS